MWSCSSGSAHASLVLGLAARRQKQTLEGRGPGLCLNLLLELSAQVYNLEPDVSMPCAGLDAMQSQVMLTGGDSFSFTPKAGGTLIVGATLQVAGARLLYELPTVPAPYPICPAKCRMCASFVLLHACTQSIL